MKKALATTIATGLLGAAMLAGAPAVSAQAAAPMPPPQAGVPGPGYSDTELRTFVGAAKQVAMITEDYAPRIHEAQGQPKQQELIKEADEKMIEAVQQEGLSVEKFLDINQSVQQDPALMRRVEQIRENG